MLKWIWVAIAGFGLVGLGKISRDTIETMGSLVHFSCRPIANQVICELTHEPLIGQLQTVQLQKTDLQRTTLQQGRRSQDQRLAIVLRSGEEIPLTQNWSRSNHEQLLPQREVLDQFIADQSATKVYVRTHRPGQLWVILGGLIGGMVGLMAIGLKLVRS